MTNTALLVYCLEQTDLEKITPILKKYLETPGSDINASLDTFNRAAIHIAVMRGDIPAVQLLLQKGANINCTSNERTPLLIAIQKTDTDMVHFLLENEADLNLIDQKTITNQPILKLLSQYSQTLRGPIPLPLLMSYTNAILPNVVCEIINSYLPPLPQTACNTENQEQAAQRAKGCCAIS